VNRILTVTTTRSVLFYGSYPCGCILLVLLGEKPFAKNFVRLRPKPGNVGRPARYSKLSFVYCRYWRGKFKTCFCKRHCIRATSYKGLLMQYLCDCSSLYDTCSVICKELIQSTSGYKYKQRYTDICPCTAQQPIQNFCPHIKFNASNPYSRILFNITGKLQFLKL